MARRGSRGGRELRDPLSRDERAAYGAESGFSPLQYHVICPSCLDNQLSPPSLADPSDSRGRRHGRKHFYSCENCSGFGVVPASRKEGLDQYMLPRRGH
jgi:hypothetical protein